jgi:hypothetical protein
MGERGLHKNSKKEVIFQEIPSSVRIALYPSLNMKRVVSLFLNKE